ncbi:nucleotide-diphospho-sugar transferase [Aspergillus oleicola]
MPVLACYPSAKSVEAVLVLIFVWAMLMVGSKFWSISSDSIGTSGTLNQQQLPPDPSLVSSPPRYAFAIILTGESDTEWDVESPYFMVARLLTFQLLHSPATRSTHDLPLLVLVMENIPEEQRALLTKEDTVVIPVNNITREWVLAKLNIWKMTAYDKIAFLDADSILFKQIDGIFTEPNLPPTREPGKDFYIRDNYMNAGFFVLAQSETMFNYYLALLNQPSAFNLSYPKQNLLKYAHRIDSRMPWRDIGHHWNQKGTSRTEYQGGLKSVHQKWWVSMGDNILDKYVAKVLAEMKAFDGLA